MTAIKIYKKGNYLIIEDVDNNNRFIEDLLVNVRCSKTEIGSSDYFIYLGQSNETYTATYPYISMENGNAYATQADWETFIFGCTGNANCTTTGGGGGGATNLSYTASPTNGVVNSDTGTDATIPLVTTVNAGLQSPSDKTKLDGIQAGAEVNVNADWLATSGDALILNKPTSLPSSVLKHSVKYGEALTIGQAVYVSSADGTNMIVSKADYSTESTSSKTLGLATASGALNYQGEVVTEGLLAGLDTSTATIGDAVWLGDNGNLLYGLANKPVAPNHMVFIGIVTRANLNNGEIFVKVQNGFELQEIHNVLIQSLVDKHILYWDSATSLWKNTNINSVIGFTPANQSRLINTTTPLQGGGDLSADRTLSILQATTSQDGYLTSTDWNTFNNKQNALSGGTTNRLTKWTSASAIGNSQIADDGTSLAIGASLNSTVQLGISTNKATALKSTSSTGVGVNGVSTNATGGTGVKGESTGGYGLFGVSNSTSVDNVGTYGSATDSNGLNIGGKFVAGGTSGSKYSVQLQDGTEAIGKFLKSITADGKSNWTTLTVADTGLTLTTVGTSGSATLVGNTLNIPNYSSGGSNDLFKFGANEFFRGLTINNNSTSVTTEGGVTMSTSASTQAQTVASTAFNLKNIRLRYYATVVSTGRYTGTRGSALLWYVGGGFRYTCSFSISDSSYNAGCRQFFGMAGVTTDLTYTDTILVASMQNIIGIGSDALDANLQVFTNDTVGSASKIDLGANFPANRTSGSASTTIYQVQIYNPSGSSSVYYRVNNLETGNSTEGTLTTDLPALTQGLNFFASRCMGTPLTNSGEFYLYNKFGVYSVA